MAFWPGTVEMVTRVVKTFGVELVVIMDRWRDLYDNRRSAQTSAFCIKKKEKKNTKRKNYL